MDTRVKNAIKYISDNLDKPLELSEVARAALVSPYHFHRLFKKEINISLKEFIEYYKIEKAYSLITDSNANVREIAMKLGYNNYETFSRAFKRLYKVSPDDLKSIIQKALENVGIADKVIKKVVVVDDNKKSQSEEELRRIIKELTGKDVSKEQLMRTKLVYVDTAPKMDNLSADDKMVKNKYSLKDKSKLWNSVVKKMKSENLL